jgi:hypothetical protein
MSDYASLERGLGRVEARVQDLSEQIALQRQEMSAMVKSVEGTMASHRERIIALESFRKWAIGVMTALFLSGAAAVFAYVLRKG